MHAILHHVTWPLAIAAATVAIARFFHPALFSEYAFLIFVIGATLCATLSVSK